MTQTQPSRKAGGEGREVSSRYEPGVLAGKKHLEMAVPDCSSFSHTLEESDYGGLIFPILSLSY